MRATIHHNPRCGTARATLAILEATPGVEVEVIDYLRRPLTTERLAELYARAGMTPSEGMRAKEQLAKDLRLAEASGEAILRAMAEHPILIERPLVETPLGVRLCRPPERVREILPAA